MYLMLFLCGDNKVNTFNNLFEFYNVCDKKEGTNKEKKFSKEEFKGFVGTVFKALVVYSYTMGAWPNTDCDEEKCGKCEENVTNTEVDKVVNACFGDSTELTSAELCTNMTEGEKVSKMNMFNPRGWRGTFLGEGFQQADHLEKPVVEEEEEEKEEEEKVEEEETGQQQGEDQEEEDQKSGSGSGKEDKKDK